MDRGKENKMFLCGHWLASAVVWAKLLPNFLVLFPTDLTLNNSLCIDLHLNICTDLSLLMGELSNLVSHAIIMDFYNVFSLAL